MDFEDRMIEAIERGECSPEDAYDHVRETMADAADRLRDQRIQDRLLEADNRRIRADANARMNAALQGSVPKDIAD
jgi:hypothetical protein